MGLLCLLAGVSTNAIADIYYGTPTKVPNMDDRLEWSPNMSRDGLEIYYALNEINNAIWVSKRSTINDGWSEPVIVDIPFHPGGKRISACLSADGLELYVADQDNPEGYGMTDLWVTTRASKDAPWGVPENLGPVINSEHDEASPCISADGLELYFMLLIDGHPNRSEILMASRPTREDPWGEPVNLGWAVNSNDFEYTPFISDDGLALFFSRGYSKSHIYVCRRSSTTSPWGGAVFFDPVNSGTPNDMYTSSAGECETKVFFVNEDPTLYFTRAATLFDNYSLWQMKIHPIVDFNGDGQVDGKDLLIMTDHWELGDPACDIAPLPMTDGFVDLQDLRVLARYIGRDVNDPTLLAHWALDETEGNLAYENRAQLDAVAIGEPQWQPEAGHISGALKFDGMDDFLDAPFVLDPAKDVFSVFAWVKGGMPGQVILSQAQGANWLMIDPEAGTLRTNLSDPVEEGRWGPIGGLPLVSPAVITDDQWHRVGLVKDGYERILYVDDVEVARDTIAGIEGSTGRMFIGTGKYLESGTFWSGVIDDVRIYKRVVVP